MEHESSIHDFDFSLICRYFSLLRRQGPGSDAITRKALSLIPTGLSVSKAADLGCGTGTQTMVLAEGLQERQDADNLEITALDLFPQFLDILSLRSRERGLDGIIGCLPGDMSQLPFQNGSLDLIWSEGAIYNVGFRSGLEQWKRYLRPGGCIAVSDATWLTNERPAEVEEFWRDAYPQIGTTSERLAIMEELGFTVLPSQANFIFAKSDKLPGGELYRKLKENGILVRWFDADRIRDYVRITIGSLEQMTALVDEIARLLEEL